MKSMVMIAEPLGLRHDHRSMKGVGEITQRDLSAILTGESLDLDIYHLWYP